MNSTAAPTTIDPTNLPEGIITTGTKTGKKVHAAGNGSSVTLCGHWMKHNAALSRRYQPVNCERCIGVALTHQGYKH